VHVILRYLEADARRTDCSSRPARQKKFATPLPKEKRRASWCVPVIPAMVENVEEAWFKWEAQSSNPSTAKKKKKLPMQYTIINTAGFKKKKEKKKERNQSSQLIKNKTKTDKTTHSTHFQDEITEQN
jgi:hypothetical protein